MRALLQLIAGDTERRLVAEAFAEWRRRYQADPAAFADTEPDDPAAAGEADAAYFLELLADVARVQVAAEALR